MTNDGVSNDGSGFDTFNIGAITDGASGSVSIAGTQIDGNNLTVNISSATVGSDFYVANSDGTSANGVTVTVNGNLSAATVEVVNNQLTTATNNVNLIVTGNLNTSGLVTVTGGSTNAADGILTLEGSTISTGGFSLGSTGPGDNGVGILQIGGSSAQTVTGAINSSAAANYGTLQIGENNNGATSNNITVQSNIGNVNPIGNVIIEGTGTNTFNGTVASDFISIVSKAVFNNNVAATGQIDFWADGTMTVANGVNVSGAILDDKAVSGAANLGTLILEGTSTLTGNVGASGSELKQVTLSGSNITDSVTGSVATQNINLGTNTLSVNGAYEQSANGTIATTISSSSIYGKITATGAATVPTSTKVAVTVTGTLPNTTAIFNLINDNGSAGLNVPGSVSVTGSSRIFRAMLSSGDLILYLEAPGGLTAETLTANGQRAATALDNITGSASGDMGNVINELIGFTQPQVNAAVNTMLPLTGINMQAATQMMDDFVNTQMTHLDGPTNSQTTIVTGVPFDEQPMDTAAWAQTSGTSAHQSPRGTTNGYNLTDAGGVVGIEKGFTDALRMGLAAGDAYSWVVAKDQDGKVNINAVQGSVYGRYKNQQYPWYFNYAILYAYNSYSSSRAINVSTTDNRVAKADYQGNLFGGDIEGGYGITVSKIVVTPDLSVSYDYLNLRKYSEKGASSLDLNVKQQDYDRLRLAPGFKIAMPFECPWGILSPEVHASYLWDVITQQEQILASFAGGSAAFSTQGYKPGDHGVDLGLGISLATLDNFTISIQYDFEDDAEYYSSTGLVNVAHQF